MNRSIAALLLCCCTATAATAANSVETVQVKRYRFTFVIADTAGPSQSYVIDVPVTPGHAGEARMAQATGLSGIETSQVSRSLSCSEVRASEHSVAAMVTFAQYSLTLPLSQIAEPVHHQLNFERRVIVTLGKPMRITDEMHPRPLKPGDALRAPLPPPAPVITLTVDAL